VPLWSIRYTAESIVKTTKADRPFTMVSISNSNNSVNISKDSKLSQGTFRRAGGSNLKISGHCPFKG